MVVLLNDMDFFTQLPDKTSGPFRIIPHYIFSELLSREIRP